jgi:hypothetical protein
MSDITIMKSQRTFPDASQLDAPRTDLALTVGTALALSFGIAIAAAAVFVAAGVLVSR